MFRTLIYPSSGAYDYSVELPHWSYFSWFDVCWRFGVVGFEWYPCCNWSCASWCVFSKQCTKLTLHSNHRTGHLKTEHTESLFLLRRHLGNWPRGPAVSMRCEPQVAHEKLWQLLLLTVYAVPVLSWGLSFLLTFETAPFFCVYPVYGLRAGIWEEPGKDVKWEIWWYVTTLILIHVIKFVGCRTLQDEDFESVRTKTGCFPFKILNQNFLDDAEKNVDMYSLREKIKFETFLIKCMTVTQYSATFLWKSWLCCRNLCYWWKVFKTMNVVQCVLVVKQVHINFRL